MSDSGNSNIKRLRTFADDMAAVHPSASPSSSKPAVGHSTTKQKAPVEPAPQKSPAEASELFTPTKPAEPTPPPAPNTKEMPVAKTPPAASLPTPPLPTPTPIEEQKPTPPKPVLSETLTKEISSAAPKPTSVLSSQTELFDTREAVEGGGEGTIVTDKKRARFRLFPAIWEALMSWFGTKHAHLTPAPKPKINAPEKRKQTIATASSGSKLAPKDDFAATAERLQEQERTTEETKLTLLDKTDTPTPSWQHITDDEDSDTLANLRSSDTSANAAVDQAEVAAPEESAIPLFATANTPTIPDTTPVTETSTNEDAPLWRTSTTYPTQEETPEPEVEMTAPIIKPTSEAPTAEPTPPPVPDIPPQETEVADAPAIQTPPTEPEPEEPVVPPGPTFSRRSVPEYRLNKLGQPIPKTSSGTPYLTLAAVIIAAVVLGVSVSVWFFTRTTTPPSVVVPSPSDALVETSARSALALPGSRLELYAALESNAGVGTEEFYFTLGDTAADPSSVFGTLDWSAPLNLQRAVTAMSFGSSNNEPFIVLKFTSFDTVFAGLLSWESAMSSELAPLFGSAVATRETIDSRINNRDVRVLLSEQNEDIVVYGFLDKNTLLIAPDRTTFGTVAPQIR